MIQRSKWKVCQKSEDEGESQARFTFLALSLERVL
jgi:hypothetical protein